MSRRVTSLTSPHPERSSVPPAPAPSEGRARVHAMFDAHHDLIWRTLRRCGLDGDAAADVTQQVFVVAIERLADIWPGSERAFLMGTALRLSRRARQSGARFALDAGLGERLSQSGPLPEKQVATVELLDRVLSGLDRELVEVFVLFDIEGFSGPELARALGMPAGTVASRVRRAREAFRAVVERLSHVSAREESG